MQMRVEPEVGFQAMNYREEVPGHRHRLCDALIPGAIAQDFPDALRDYFLACRRHFRTIEALLVLLAEQSREDAVFVLKLRDLASARNRQLAENPRCRAAERQDDDGHRACHNGLTTALSGEVLCGAQLSPSCLPLLDLTCRRYCLACRKTGPVRLAEPGAKVKLGDQSVASHCRMIAVNQIVVTAPALRADIANACFSSITSAVLASSAGGAVRPHLFNH
jgi:hypothetical protein